mgnify:CR=1 FL=1
MNEFNQIAKAGLMISNKIPPDTIDDLALCITEPCFAVIYLKLQTENGVDYESR